MEGKIEIIGLAAGLGGSLTSGGSKNEKGYDVERKYNTEKIRLGQTGTQLWLNYSKEREPIIYRNRNYSTKMKYGNGEEKMQ